MKPDYNFSRCLSNTISIPDFIYYYLMKILILVIKIKRKHVLENISEQLFPEFYKTNKKAKMVIQQIYNYMRKNKHRYGILATYDNYWFLH